MEPLRLDPVPARVVAWHNRHPLAGRITPAQVGSMGYVALPFVQTPGKRGLRRGFDEDFLEGASPGRIARWAVRHGVTAPEAPADGPLRAVQIEGSRFGPEDQMVTLYLRTALVDDGWRASRVLLGGGDRPAVWGRRLWHRPRQAVAGVLLAGATALAVALAWPRDSAPADMPLVAEGAMLAASAAASAASAAEPVPPPVAVAAADRPVDVEPQLGKIDLPSLRPTLGPASTRVKPPPPAPAADHADAPADKPPAARAPAPAAPAPAAPPAAAPVWALTTRAFRSEAETDQTTVAMAALLQRAGLRSVRVQALQVGGAWHVVGMPFPTRDAAENARNLLASRGVRTEPVEF